MRTNIEIDDQILDEAKRLTGLSTKRAVVARALEELIRKERRRAVLALEGALAWEAPPFVERDFGPEER